MIVKKHYPESHRNRNRIWRLKRMAIEKDEESKHGKRQQEQVAREEYV